MTANPELLKRITARPDVYGGKPIIRDLRISVELILSLLTQGVTTDAILEDYPELEPEDIRACTAYAHAVIAKDSLDAVSIGWECEKRQRRLTRSSRFDLTPTAHRGHPGRPRP